MSCTAFVATIEVFRFFLGTITKINELFFYKIYFYLRSTQHNFPVISGVTFCSNL